MPHRSVDEERTDGLKRLVAGRDVAKFGVKKGDRGGLISNETNVSDDSWIDYNSRVIDSYVVRGAYVYRSSIVRSTIEGGAHIRESDIADSAIKGGGVKRSKLRQANVDNCLIMLSWVQDAKCVSFNLAGAHVVDAIAEYGHVELQGIEDLWDMYSLPIGAEDATTFGDVLPDRFWDHNVVVRYSILLGTHVNGQSHVFQSIVEGSTITRSDIHASRVEDSKVTGRSVHDALVRRQRPAGSIRWWRYPPYMPAAETDTAWRTVYDRLFDRFSGHWWKLSLRTRAGRWVG